VIPLVQYHPTFAGHSGRLRELPSFRRVLEGAAPYLHLFPQG